MFITFNKNQLDRLLQALYQTSFRGLSSGALENTLGVYRPDALRSFQRMQTNQRVVKAMLLALRAKSLGHEYLYMSRLADLPDGIESLGSFTDANGTLWTIFGSDDSTLSRTDVIGKIDTRDVDFDMILTGQPVAEEAPSNGLSFERQYNIVLIRPDEEHLATLSANARPFALRIGTYAAGGDTMPRFEVSFEENAFTMTQLPAVAAQPTIQGGAPTVEELLTEARTAYREWLRVTMGRPTFDAEEAAKREAARKASAERFSVFARRERDPERHVPNLPFVPHGLSSSRRWGIEVESGGARGIEAPKHWERKYDGSLRSAWDGYKEVQDFEPFDEEVTEWRPVSRCSVDHIIETTHYNSRTDEYDYRPNPNYVDPRECTECGEYTHTVHREPQTIVHQASGDDCAEFVSPILVSMHSNGLKAITDELIKQPQNDSAGVHVHVEANDLTNAQVATLIFGYDILEPLLEESYQRESRRYCERRAPEQVLEAARKLRNGGKEIAANEVRGGNRYVTLNTTALNAHGTIEFRAMGPVYDYDYLVRWAMLCRELVNLVAAGVTVSQFSRVKKWKDLTMLLAEYGKEYIRASVYEATGDTGTAADLVKQGSEVTTDALDSDVTNFLTLIQGAQSSGERIQQMVASVQRFLSAGRPVGDLVGVGGRDVSNRWMA